MKNQIREALTKGLDGLSVTPAQHGKILACIHRGGKQHVSFGRTVALTAVLVMLAATACAVTVYELVKPKMDQLAAVVVSGDWDFDTKSRYVALLEDFGFDLDKEQLAIFSNDALPLEERSNAADLLIDAIYGDTMRASLNPSIVQQETYPMPDDETVFYDLYRRADPGATDGEIAEAYAQWVQEAYPPADEAPAQQEKTEMTQEELREKCETYLSEVLNFNKLERQKCSMTFTYDENNGIWVAHFSISSGDLREALKNEWVTDAYHEETQMYTWEVLYDKYGTLIGTEDLFAYLIQQLIPSEAYPGYEVWKDEYRAFLYCSTEERALFSEQWKPVVDQFLSKYPDAEAYFHTDSAYSTAYITTRHVYGNPDENVLSQAAAIALARAAYLSSGVEGVSEEMIDQRCDGYVLYDVTDEEHPLWKVSFSHDVTNIKTGDAMGGYFVVIDASTGEILRQYVRNGKTISSAYEFAELLD